MSAGQIDAKTAMDKLEEFVRAVEGLSDHELRENLLRPGKRAEALSLREDIQPWLQLMNRMANANHRLSKALNRTAGQVRA